MNNINPAISIIIEDFNGECSKRYSFDTSDNTITSTVGYILIIDKSIRFKSQISSCIGLIFTSNLSIIVDSGIEKSLCSSCHDDIIYGKMHDIYDIMYHIIVVGPLLFLIYINDLSHDISSICKMFANDTSLSSKVKDFNLFLSDINYDLETINQRAYQWKMLFNPDPNKQATEVLFSRKIS